MTAHNIFSVNPLASEFVRQYGTPETNESFSFWLPFGGLGGNWLLASGRSWTSKSNYIFHPFELLMWFQSRQTKIKHPKSIHTVLLASTVLCNRCLNLLFLTFPRALKLAIMRSWYEARLIFFQMSKISNILWTHYKAAWEEEWNVSQWIQRSVSNMARSAVLGSSRSDGLSRGIRFVNSKITWITTKTTTGLLVARQLSLLP